MFWVSGVLCVLGMRATYGSEERTGTIIALSARQLGVVWCSWCCCGELVTRPVEVPRLEAAAASAGLVGLDIAGSLKVAFQRIAISMNMHADELSIDAAVVAILRRLHPLEEV